jgi:hypothetical protein
VETVANNCELKIQLATQRPSITIPLAARQTRGLLRLDFRQA